MKKIIFAAIIISLMAFAFETPSAPTPKGNTIAKLDTKGGKGGKGHRGRPKGKEASATC